MIEINCNDKEISFFRSANSEKLNERMGGDFQRATEILWDPVKKQWEVRAVIEAVKTFLNGSSMVDQIILTYRLSPPLWAGKTYQSCVEWELKNTELIRSWKKKG
jgi:hypothetical protein